jgi:hypothetical protein
MHLFRGMYLVKELKALGGLLAAKDTDDARLQ